MAEFVSGGGESIQVGARRISLGGYTDTVLASLEDSLGCVMAEFLPETVCTWRFSLQSTLERRIPTAPDANIDRDRVRQTVVSVFCLAPEIEKSRRFI